MARSIVFLCQRIEFIEKQNILVSIFQDKLLVLLLHEKEKENKIIRTKLLFLHMICPDSSRIYNLYLSEKVNFPLLPRVMQRKFFNFNGYQGSGEMMENVIPFPSVWKVAVMQKKQTSKDIYYRICILKCLLQKERHTFASFKQSILSLFRKKSDL